MAADLVREDRLKIAIASALLAGAAMWLLYIAAIARKSNELKKR